MLKMFYNKWTHDHYVGNVFVFVPSGVIIACAVNALGSMHDSSIPDWGGVYTKLEKICSTCGGFCVVDYAFSKGHFPFLIMSSQDALGASNENAAIYSQLRQATAVRQASEWGMQALQGIFPRLKESFLYQYNVERKVMLYCIVLLFSIRTRLVGMNQILSTFMPHSSAEANHFFSQEVGL